MAPAKNSWQDLRKVALQYPEAEEGTACKGTALECPTVHVRNKTFLFLGRQDLKLKLQASLAEAKHLATKEPDRYQVGSTGWVTVKLGQGSPSSGLLEKWIEESYRLIAPKKLVATLPEGRLPQAISKRAVSNRTPASKTAKKKDARKNRFLSET